MLPHVERRPPQRNQPLVHLDVAFSVPCDLGTPELRVRLGGHSVLGASMPEAAVHEHRDADPHKHDVGPSRQTSTAAAESHAEAVERAPERRLRSRVAATYAAHEVADGLAGRRRATGYHLTDTEGMRR